LGWFQSCIFFFFTDAEHFTQMAMEELRKASQQFHDSFSLHVNEAQPVSHEHDASGKTYADDIVVHDLYLSF
jgi:hypothetical protein